MSVSLIALPNIHFDGNLLFVWLAKLCRGFLSSEREKCKELMSFILWNLFSKCIQGRLDCIGETVLVKGEISLNNGFMVSASTYNVFLCISCFLYFGILHIFCLLSVMCQLSITVDFVKMSPDLLNFSKDEDISQSLEVICLLLSCWWTEVKANGNCKWETHAATCLSSEVLCSVA